MALADGDNTPLDHFRLSILGALFQRLQSEQSGADYFVIQFKMYARSCPTLCGDLLGFHRKQASHLSPRARFREPHLIAQISQLSECSQVSMFAASPVLQLNVLPSLRVPICHGLHDAPRADWPFSDSVEVGYKPSNLSTVASQQSSTK